MVALGVVASPRRDGNTATAVDDVLAGATEQGADRATLRLEAIAPIADCARCLAAGACSVRDGFPAAMERVYAADLLVIGTPLYWYGPSAQLKAFLDRWSCCLDTCEAEFRERMRGKPAVLVVAQGERGFYEAAPCLQMLEWTLRYLSMPVAARVVVVGHARGDYAADDEQRRAVRHVGASAAATGRGPDVLPPWFHLERRAGTPLGGVFRN